MPIFDAHALSLSQRRAARRSESFLDRRIWEDLEDSIDLLAARPKRALLLGPLTASAKEFSRRSGIDLLSDPDQAADADLLLLVRWVETEDDLPEKLAALAHLAAPETPLLGAAFGGDTLKALRQALATVASTEGFAEARVHPRLEPGAFAELLQRAGFERPVVNVDRVEVRFSSFRRLVNDLRDLGATNRLQARSRSGTRREFLRQLEDAYPPGTLERFDILHFSAWAASR